jgi:hypothetical protein
MLVSLFCLAGGLTEPSVVPRFIEALEAAGAAAVRVPAYLTTLGLPGLECCAAEAQLLQQGRIDAIAFSSTAEVRLQQHLTCDLAQQCGWKQSHNRVLRKLPPIAVGSTVRIKGFHDDYSAAALACARTPSACPGEASTLPLKAGFAHTSQEESPYRP